MVRKLTDYAGWDVHLLDQAHDACIGQWNEDVRYQYLADTTNGRAWTPSRRGSAGRGYDGVDDGLRRRQGTSGGEA